MGINRAEQQLQDRLVKKVAELERDLRELKTATQPVGADVLRVRGVPSSTYLFGGPIQILSGGSLTFEIIITPASSTLTLWNFLHSIYIDSATVDANYQWPTGASLSSAQKDMTITAWLDWGDSSDTSNIRVFKVRVKNNDASAHDAAIAARAFLPQLSGVTGA